VAGRAGFVAAFSNIGILLSIVDMLEPSYPTGAHVVSVESIRIEAFRARLLLLLSIIIEPVIDPKKICYPAFESYLSVVAQTSYLVKDYHPEYYTEYKSYVTGTGRGREVARMKWAKGA